MLLQNVVVVKVRRNSRNLHTRMSDVLLPVASASVRVESYCKNPSFHLASIQCYTQSLLPERDPFIETHFPRNQVTLIPDLVDEYQLTSLEPDYITLIYLRFSSPPRLPNQPLDNLWSLDGEPTGLASYTWVRLKSQHVAT